MASNVYSSYPIMVDIHDHDHEQHYNSKNATNGDHHLRLNLEREGRCPDCGIQTHHLHHRTVNMTSARGSGAGLTGPLSSTAVLVHKEPLMIDDEVYNGRCLLCRPFAEDGRQQQRQHQDTHVSDNYSGNANMSYASSRDPQQLQIHNATSNEEEPETNNDNDDDEILTILFRMRRSPHDLPLQTSSFHSLWVLSYETENARAIGRVGGIPILLESLRLHLHAHVSINNRYNRNNYTSSPSALQRMQLVKNGMATLQNLSVNRYNKEHLVEQSQLQLQLQQSQQLSHGNPNSSTMTSGIPLILLSMSTFLHNPEIVCSGCNALANILSNGGCYRLTILNHGGLNAVLRGVEFHNDNEGVVQAAYRCLCLLGQRSTTTAARRRMGEFGGKGDMTDEEGSMNGNNSARVEEEEGGGDGDAFMFDMDTSARSALST